MNIKTTVLGIDQRQGEYWLFKDDLTRLYIKQKGAQEKLRIAFEIADQDEDKLADDNAEDKVNGDQDAEMEVENQPGKLQAKNGDQKDPVDKWLFIDEEEDFETLLESLNAKGIHEKKLIENLKKIRSSLKLKKVKKAASPAQLDASGQAKPAPEDGQQNQQNTNKT